MSTSETDIAWLAGIVDGEGCFSVKRGRGARASAHQLWLVICNTSETMIKRVERILVANGVEFPPVRKVWKGERATRWQWWIHVQKKHALLKVTGLLLPHLTAKRDEALVFAWFLRRACAVKKYKSTLFDKAALDALSAVKRNGGEAPAEVRELLREVIPSQAVQGDRLVDDQGTEGVEARAKTSTSNSLHECPAALN